MWVPELPFQLACGRDGALRDRPLPFLNPENPRSPALWCVNRRGRAEGLASGMPMDIVFPEFMAPLPGVQPQQSTRDSASVVQIATKEY